MNYGKIFALVAVAALTTVAAPAQAGSGKGGCWYGKCGGGQTPGTNPGGSTGGTPTQVPEPEQIGIFAMGIALVGARMIRARRRK